MVKGKFLFEIIYRQYTVLYLTFVTTTKQGICPPQAMPLPTGTKLHIEGGVSPVDSRHSRISIKGFIIRPLCHLPDVAANFHIQ